MKKMIHLKESELRNMIYEQVQNIISELDWKTYHRSGSKALDMDDEERADDFYNNAEKEFRKKHGINLSQVSQGVGSASIDDDNYWNAMSDWEDYASGRSKYVNGKGWTKNESKLRKQIAESLRRSLNEHKGINTK